MGKFPHNHTQIFPNTTGNLLGMGTLWQTKSQIPQQQILLSGVWPQSFGDPPRDASRPLWGQNPQSIKQRGTNAAKGRL
jgi:hypothetical protein